MTVFPQSIPEVLLIIPRVFADSRGCFAETYQEQRMTALGLPHFVQDNESCSQRGVLRGLHYQAAPYAQGKLVRVVAGAAWDVAVDIRPESPSFGKWTAVTLSAANHAMLWIPPGFAHGFVALENNTTFAYKCSALYNQQAERGIRWDDPTLAIIWPVDNPLVSPRDAALPLMA